jgi:Flp pilus assembly protein CpaB
VTGAPVSGAVVGFTPRSRQRWRARVSQAHVVVALAGVLGALLTLSAVHAANRSVRVLALRHDVTAGQRVRAGDLTVTGVHVDGDVLSSLVGARDQRVAVGQIAVTDLHAGELLRVADLRRAAATGDARAMSFAIDASSALDGTLQPGDRIDVIAVGRDGVGAGFVLVDAPVLAADNGHDSGPLRDTRSRVTLTVAVDADDALRLASALSAGDVTVLRSTGARAASDAARYEPPAKAGDDG